MSRSSLQALVLAALCLVVGIATLRDYGESYDEADFYGYADHALGSYGTWLHSQDIIVTGGTFDNYGPAFAMATELTARGLHAIMPGWLVSDLRHLVYLVTFIAGIYAFHALARRWMSDIGAFASTGLFVTQPILWGHAFMNPKDIPFMSAFIIAVALGFRMADMLAATATTSARSTAPALWVIGLWILTLLVVFLTSRQLNQRVADMMSHHRSVQRALATLTYCRLAYFAASTLSIGLWLRKRYPDVQWLLLGGVLPAAVALGATSAIRILGPLAGLPTAAYVLQRHGRKSLPSLFAYAVGAVAVMVALWPYLWPDPFGHFSESFSVMSRYPWVQRALFNGQYFQATELPRSYLPVLLAVQLTEPTWPAFLLGLAIIWRNRALLVVTLLWFVFPLAALIVWRAPVYDNTRQISFCLPPVFLVAGVGFEHLVRRFRRPVVRGLMVAALVLPGIIAAVQLHPYEYVYYNGFIGGLRGAEGRFELEYWATSYRAAMDYVNRVAPAGAKVFVAGPTQIAEVYARPDLALFRATELDTQVFDYAVITTRYGLEKWVLAPAPVVHVVEREGVPFTVVKKIR